MPREYLQEAFQSQKHQIYDLVVGNRRAEAAATVYLDEELDGLIQLEFSDGTTTDRHGGGGGVEKVLELAADEDIVRVTCVAGNEWVQRLQFETSAGRLHVRWLAAVS